MLSPVKASVSCQPQRFHANWVPTLVVIDAAVSDADRLAAAVRQGAVVELGAGNLAHSIAQITAALRPGMGRLVLVAHGEPGVVHLGGETLTRSALVQHQVALRTWAVDEIVVCSCRVGADAEFVDQLAAVTGSRVVASAKALGAGVWLPQMEEVFELEALQRYSGTLAPFVTSTNSFETQSTFAAGTSPYSVTVGDFNGDGRADLAIVNLGSNSVSVLLGNGSGGFNAQFTFATGTRPKSVTTADFNGDGKTDLAVANSGSDTVSVLLGNGFGGFSTPLSRPTDTTPTSVTTADFNGDGKVDLAVANYGSRNVSVLSGNGGGGFRTSNTFATGARSSSVITADFDGDGDADLAVANYSLNTVSVFFGNSFGGLNGPYISVTGVRPSSLATADFNGDGKADLAVANSVSNTVSVLLGNSNGGFNTQSTFATGFRPFSVTIGDFNGDGNADLAVANSSSNDVSVLLGNGNGSFNAESTFDTGFRPTSVATGDFNGDGKTDLAIANSYSGNVSILLNTVVPAFSLPPNGTYTTGQSLTFTVNFSEEVLVTGVPVLPLTIGSTTRNATYSSGSGTTRLTFTYRIAAGDLDTNGITVGNGIALNGGTIKDVAGNNSVLSVPVVNSAGILVDGVLPTITSFTASPSTGTFGVGSTIAITANFSEAVTLANGNLVLTLDNGATVNLTTINGTNTASGTYTVAAGQTSSDLNVSSVALASGATLKDAAGNAINLTTLPMSTNALSGSAAIAIDTIAPTLTSFTASPSTGTFGVGSTIAITANFSEAVTLANGNLVLTLNNGATVNLTTLNGTTASGTYTVGAGQTSSNLNVSSVALALGATLKDAAGNGINTPLPTGANALSGSAAIAIDTITPTITSFTSTTPPGTYGAGDLINITVNFSEAVTLANGNLVLTLSSGATVNLTTINGTNASGTYTIAAGENASVLDISAIALSNGATLNDAAGNPLTFATLPTGTNALAGSTAFVVESIVPGITSITSPTPDGTYSIGKTIDITVNFNKPLTLTGGNLTLTLDTGATLTIAPFSNATSASATYTIAAGQTSPDLNVTTLTLASGATLKDAANKSATLTIPTGQELKANKAIVIDRSAPKLSGTPTLTIAEDSPYTFTPTAVDPDPEVLTFTITNKPAWATFDPATGKLSGTPTNTNVGTTNNIIISVNDKTETISLPAFNLTVTNINDSPVLGTPIVLTTNQNAIALQPFTFTVPTTAFTDLDPSEILTFSLTTANNTPLPPWLKFNAQTRTLSGTPDSASVGDLNLKVIATDRDGSAVSQTFKLAIVNPTDITGTAPAPITITEGKKGITSTGSQLVGTPKNDRLTGTAKSDRLKALRGSDRIFGNAGNDRLMGNGGKDILDGGKGNDFLKGDGGNDLLLGGDDQDKLLGGKGNDILLGGQGADRLTGGKQRDTFTFGSVNEGIDTVTDFNATEDLIDLRVIFNQPQFSGATPYVRYLQQIKLVQVGSSTEVRIDADGNGIGSTMNTLAVLQNVNTSALTSRNFVIA
jgi:Ca2+-binding RTX toxin-like protein